MMAETGDELKCESRVAEISRIEILTTLRTVQVQNYETFELIGYDRLHNAFSTLEGVYFSWTLEKASPKGDAILVSFRDAAIKTTDLRHNMESSGLQTDMVVLSGVHSGLVTVRAAMLEKSKQVRPWSSPRVYGPLSRLQSLNSLYCFRIEIS